MTPTCILPHNMTEIPHLIREKVKDYLNAIYLLEWRSRMDIICDEYNKKTLSWNCVKTIAGTLKAYNFRSYNTIYKYKWTHDPIYSREGQIVGKLSPNY